MLGTRGVAGGDPRAMTLLRLNILEGTSEDGAVCYDRGAAR